MKILRLLCAATLVFLSLSSLYAQTVDNDEKYFRYKCYVVYLGGGDDIQYLSNSKSNLQSAYQHYNGRKVKTNIVKKNGRAVDKTIYKIPECKRMNESFSLGRAQQIERKVIQ